MARTKLPRPAPRPGPAEPPSPPLASGAPADEEPSLTARRVRGARAAIVLGALAAFVGTFDNAILRNWDDERFLADPDVLRPSLSGLVGFFTEVRYEAYHPLHLLSYWLDVPWVGNEGAVAAAVIHGTNLALWIGVLLVAFELLRRLGLTPLAAAVAALTFGIHPQAVEVVCWASARKDILAIGLAMGSVLAHLGVPPEADVSRDRRAWISRGLFLLAALAKTTVLPLPLALVGVDLWTRRRSLRQALRLQLPALVAALALGLVVLRVWQDHHMIRNTGTDREPFDAALVPATLFHLLEAALWPVRLAAIYPLQRHEPLPLALGLAACVAVAAGLAMAWPQRERPFGARLGLGLSWFLIFALPVLNLVPMYFQWQDRYGVLAMFGLAIVVGAGIDALRTERPRETAIRVLVSAAVLLLPLGHLTSLQVETWRDEDHLWGHATRTQPNAVYAWIKLGETRRDRRDLEGAVRAYARAVEVAPELRMAHAGFLSALALRDERSERIEPSAALSLATRYLVLIDDARRLRDLASEMVDQGYRDAAAYVLGRSLDLDPVSNERLERAILVQLRGGNTFMARFYLSRLTSRPMLPEVTAFWEAERERLGLVTDEEREARERGERPEVTPLVLPGPP